MDQGPRMVWQVFWDSQQGEWHEQQWTEDKVKRLVREFNRDDKASIAHALMHLEANNGLSDKS
jgi:hypothetical protein